MNVKLIGITGGSGSGKSTVVRKISEAHPDIQIYCGNLDRCLNENAYICPGLGDAGDRIFGTK